MKGLPSTGSTAYSDICEHSEQRITQQFAATVELIRGFLIVDGGITISARIDALHVAAAAVHKMDYLLTWSCRHMSNAVKRPVIRLIFLNAGYLCPEICTPIELLT